MLRQVLTEAEQLALKVVELAEALILDRNHLLARAVGSLILVPGTFARPFVCDGYALGFDAARVLRNYDEAGKPPTHDVLHCVLHCLFVHPYVGRDINKRCWNLACDVAVERQNVLILGPRPGERGSAIAKALADIEGVLGRRVTAERLYRRLCDGEFDERLEELEELFCVDDHGVWYTIIDSAGAAHRDNEDGDDETAEPNDRPSRQTAGEADAANQGRGRDNPAPEQRFSPKTQGTGTGSAILEAFAKGRGGDLKMVARGTRAHEEHAWRRTAKAVMDGVALPSARIAGGTELAADLAEQARPRVGYREFLRQFAVPGEVMRLSQDEFDYVYYTYGLELYRDMPLIEPLEYREERRIRDFVIVIDTSGSVWGEAVTRFMETTFEVLSATEAFFGEVRIHILQADSEVLSDDVITTLAELREWNARMRLHGGGGTDFRPAFRYVDGLIASGEMEVPSGLLYFTDGRGTYPEARPDYRCAFIFADASYRANLVPPWAIQVVLDPETLDRGGDLR